MKTKLTKDEIVTGLTKKLGEIADAVISAQTPPVAEPAKVEKNVAEPAKVEKNVAEPAVEKTAEETSKEEKTQKSFEEISKTLSVITEKLKKIENPDANVVEQKNEIVSKALELAKDMGIDPGDLDVEFKIVEKKKGTSTSSDDNFEKKVADSDENTVNEKDNGSVLEKELAAATPEVRKEALGTYIEGIL